MIPEQITTSLPLSKKVKELGLKQESCFMWVKYSFWKKAQVWRSDITSDVTIVCLSGKREFSIPAFTASEWGEILPAKVDGNFIITSRCIDNSGYNCYAGYLESIKASYSSCEKTLPNAMAQMYIYLHENNLI